MLATLLFFGPTSPTEEHTGPTTCPSLSVCSGECPGRLYFDYPMLSIVRQSPHLRSQSTYVGIRKKGKSSATSMSLKESGGVTPCTSEQQRTSHQRTYGVQKTVRPPSEFGTPCASNPAVHHSYSNNKTLQLLKVLYLENTCPANERQHTPSKFTPFCRFPFSTQPHPRHYSVGKNKTTLEKKLGALALLF